MAVVSCLLDEGKIQCNVAIIKVTPPHKVFVSLGMGMELSKDFIWHATLVIEEANKNMSWTQGYSKIPVTDIDFWISVNQRLQATEEL